MAAFLDLPKPFFVLAPMDDVTDTVFRQIVASCAAPDLFFTEFTNVDGLQSPGRPRVLEKLRFTAGERPLIAQIWGKTSENFYKTAQQIADGTIARKFGLPDGVNFAGIDLNMGCPDKNAVRNGTCSALINNRPLAHELIQATQEGVAGKLPVSVKTRLGFSAVDLTWHEFLLGHNLAMLTVHGRTRKEMSKVPAHWDLIGEVRKLRDTIAPGTLLVGNGDVMNRKQGTELAAAQGLDGIMIGRGIFQDPFVFADPLASGSPWSDYPKAQRLDLFHRHVQLFIDTWGVETKAVAPLNKFCKIYISGFDGAKEMREQFMQCQDAETLLSLIASAAS